jgi:hypothetical protein
MSTSQRVTRGFHRLALFLAAIPLIVGALWSRGEHRQAANVTGQRGLTRRLRSGLRVRLEKP